MSPVVKNAVLGVLALGFVCAAVWRFTQAGKPDDIPDTQGSTTDWMCNHCGQVYHFTAKQVTDMQSSKDKVRHGSQYPAKLTVFWCDNCKDFLVTRAFHCAKHDTWFVHDKPDGSLGGCAKCAKEGW